MSRRPLFRTPFDVACCAIVLLLCLPLLAYMVLDPTGFTSALGQGVLELFDTVVRRCIAVAPYYLCVALGFALGYIACGAMPRGD